MKKDICIILIVLAMIGMIDVHCHAGTITNVNMSCRTYLETIKKEQILDDANWELLVKKANEEAMSEWDKSESVLEKDIKRNFDKWGNKGKEPFIIKNDTIFYRIYYSEQVFNMLSSLDNLKERLGEVLSYSEFFYKLYLKFLCDSVSALAGLPFPMPLSIYGYKCTYNNRSKQANNHLFKAFYDF